MPTLPADERPLLRLIESSPLIKQGAEAKVYKTFPFQGSSDAVATIPLLLKYRFPKAYRHPVLDAQLTKTRITQEARCLIRAAKHGVVVPGLRCVDTTAGILGLEWIEGQSIRELLGGLPENEDEELDLNDENIIEARLAMLHITEASLLTLIGEEIAKLHAADIVHGDLTTSNMMIRTTSGRKSEVVLIDFGLSYVSNMIEDKAVDLYVLERALTATHPEPELQDAPENHKTRFDRILAAYAECLGGKEWKRISARLAEVQLRGRKRSMVG